MYAEQGDHKAMQQVLDNQGAMDKKNQLLQPLFRDIKTQIRHMSYTPELEVVREYLSNRTLLQEKTKTMPKKKREDALIKLQTSYASLLKVK